MTTDNFCFYLQNRLIQTSQTGGQRYSDTSPFSIPWGKYHMKVLRPWVSSRCSPMGEKALNLVTLLPSPGFKKFLFIWYWLSKQFCQYVSEFFK
jgi:hypothetical protein